MKLSEASYYQRCVRRFKWLKRVPVPARIMETERINSLVVGLVLSVSV